MELTNLEYMLIITSLLEFNPIFQTVKSVRSKSVENLSPATFVSIFAIGGMWLYYGVTTNNMPLIVSNAIKLFSSLTVLIIYIRLKKPANKKVATLN